MRSRTTIAINFNSADNNFLATIKLSNITEIIGLNSSLSLRHNRQLKRYHDDHYPGHYDHRIDMMDSPRSFFDRPLDDMIDMMDILDIMTTE